MLANQWLKLYRLKKAGALTEAVWAMHAHEAAEAFRTPGGATFRQENQVFAELWNELGRFGGFPISSVRLRVPGAHPEGESPERDSE